MLITSNRSVAEWGMVFADPVVATAIVDQLLHHSHVLTIRGDSYRLRAKRRAALLSRPPVLASGRLRLPASRNRRDQPSTETMKPGVGAVLHDAKGQFRATFDTWDSRIA